MKIDGPRRGLSPEVKNSPTPAKEGRSASRSERSEQVTVSEEAKALAEARAPEAPDQSRVDRLRDAIANGSFKIDVERIATQMLDEER